MDSSPGFGSTPSDCELSKTARALFRLAFATAPPVTGLTSPLRSNSLAHSPKGTPSHIPATEVAGIVLRLIVGSRFQVLFHSPHWGAFHLSLTVLVHYRSSNVFSLGKWASQIPTGLACPVVLRNMSRSLIDFVYGGITLFARPFQCRSTIDQICDSLGPSQQSQLRPTTPAQQRPRAITLCEFGPFPFRSPLLRE